MDKYTISKEYLDDICKKWTSSLCGKMMKRVEITGDIDEKTQEALKKQIKELLYENVRDLKLNIRAFSYGVKFTKNTPTKK